MHLTSADITGSIAASAIGGLAGINGGSISGSSADGTVTGTTTAQSSSIGGLVGLNVGTITTSRSGATVNGRVATSVGGLVGVNDSGTIAQSLATGPATGFTQSNVGGLVGRMTDGTISQSYATGAATAGLSANAGGLVGLAAGEPFFFSIIPGTITETFATGVSDSQQAPTITPAVEGGLIAINTGANVTSSYWDTDTTGQAGNGQITAPGTDSSQGLTTAQLQGGLKQLRLGC